MASAASGFDVGGKGGGVTGGGSGVGRGEALVRGDAGAKGVCVARRADAVEGLCNEIGVAAAPVVADVADRDQMENLVSKIGAPFGAPDIIVHAAGINTREQADDVTPHGWDQTLALNLTAPFFLSQALVTALTVSYPHLPPPSTHPQ